MEFFTKIKIEDTKIKLKISESEQYSESEKFVLCDWSDLYIPSKIEVGDIADEELEQLNKNYNE